MNRQNDESEKPIDPSPSVDSFRADVLSGLRCRQKSLPCKYFYDARGSQLFEDICELEEYYLTRTELSILRENVAEIVDAIGPGAMLMEFGSGSSVKTRVLLDHLHQPAAYVPIDISRRHLMQAARNLSERYPELSVLPVVADFTSPIDVPQPRDAPQRRVVFFPGSTVGNFEGREAVRLLQHFADLCGSGGGLIIGIDLKKDRRILEAAYNDRRGVTAEFNLNILHRINRELNADFDLGQFAHRAVYNEHAGRIEMWLVCLRRQIVSMGDEEFVFEAGEEILTEYSHKYSIREFTALSQAAGFQLEKTWTDKNDLFAVLSLLSAASE